jgi:hypothetical protein
MARISSPRSLRTARISSPRSRIEWSIRSKVCSIAAIRSSSRTSGHSARSMVLPEAAAAGDSPLLKLRSDQGDQAGRKDSGGAKPELTKPLIEATDAPVELDDPFCQRSHVGPELSTPRSHLRPELGALSAELLEDTVKRRVDDGHPVVMAFVSPPSALHCTPLSLRGSASRPRPSHVPCVPRDSEGPAVFPQIAGLVARNLRSCLWWVTGHPG